MGDADLALLDRNTGHVLVLELKAVFDKFRTHVQMRNFTEQKVNFPKAMSQARGVAEAVSTGEWPLRELFDSNAPAHPSQVTAGVLTWWDTYNPTLGSSEEMLCCNFETLIYVLDEARGDLGAAVQAIRDLAGVYCPGALFPLGMTVDGEDIEARQERQGAEIPPLTRLDALGVGSLARQLIGDLPTWPEDWQSQPIEDGVARFVY